MDSLHCVTVNKILSCDEHMMLFLLIGGCIKKKKDINNSQISFSIIDRMLS